MRQSLVLLKNNGGLLPLAANKHVLVTGDGADNISKQSGGWTITWQGTGLNNADFPGGTSVWGGVKRGREGRRRQRGAVDRRLVQEEARRRRSSCSARTRTPNSRATSRCMTLPGSMTQHLEIMKKLQDEKIPVVAILISGRPLWQNRELNLANAYVAAWLPGTEGGGISDVLFRKKDGAVNYDFTGKLSYSWPRDATGAPLNVNKEPLRSAVPVRLRPDLRRAGGTRRAAGGSGHSGRAHDDGFVLRQGPAGAAVVAARLERHRHHAHHQRRRPKPSAAASR